MIAPLTYLTEVEFGIPGAPGAGVTALEKASYVTLTSANVFTNTNNVKLNSTAALTVEKADGTDVLVIDTTNKEVEVQNAGKLRGFSDNNTTETFSIDASTGAAQFDSNVTTGGRIIGDTSIWPMTIDGGGSAITTGVKFDICVPYNCTVTSWDLVADQSGSIVIDLWQDTYANFPPTVADTITTGEKPTLSAATKNQDTSLNGGSGWALTQGRFLRVNVDSAATVTRICLALHVTRS